MATTGSARRALLGLVGALTAVLLLVGCGDEGGSASDDPTDESTSAVGDGSETPTEESEPAAPAYDVACDEVWVAGQNLPESYKGCMSAEGEAVKAKKHPCSFGMPLVEYDDRFYAVAGKVINEVESLKTSQDFQSALTNCQA